MSGTTKLTITIGPREKLVDRVWSVAFLFSSILLIPTYNHFVLGAGWALDLFGAFFGLIVVAVALQKITNKHKTLETTDEAIAWLRSDEWKPKEHSQ